MRFLPNSTYPLLMIFGNDVGSFAKIVSDEVGLTVPELVDGKLLWSIGLDVGEFVVVVDRLDVERSLVRLECVVEFQLHRIGALVRVNGLGHVRLQCGELLLRLRQLDRRYKLRRTARGNQCGAIGRLDNHLQVGLPGGRCRGDILQGEAVDIAFVRDEVEV